MKSQECITIRTDSVVASPSRPPSLAHSPPLSPPPSLLSPPSPRLNPPSSPNQRTSVVDMDEEGINELLNSHGLFKRAPEEPEAEAPEEPEPDAETPQEPEPEGETPQEPEADSDSPEPSENDREEL